ncbi:DNA alkylation repair protein [Flavobacterium hibernum]|uniref:DNA alkylation repair protein n=1 Tax=Flavobacterium hibernum TaxID=37752 RepID=A0A0D0F1H6_9FLAO|nr:DNA alkylation repair protein [Flavobacterium hibernum]KIO51902.1 DNA alkylation repair protein [Flavobacterium hibernum]OXA89137.1 DNA alkylation repair protein [Flavobacterium hibernum]STO09936.1 DNA alkylation repair enzyme [Flavobacterium hibernum]
MGLIKDIYSLSFYENFSQAVAEVHPTFDKQKFIDTIYEGDFAQKEWKDRMKHTTVVLHQFMPENFPEAVAAIDKIINNLKKNKFTDGNLAFIFFADYIEIYGLNDFKTSAKAFVSITQFISCEFAVRPFILKYKEKMIDEMVKWSLHENHHVRRLSSEGSRSRLPWAMAIPFLKKDPASILPILENLKNDPSEYVRRSVANSLNDIAKDNPETVLEIANLWKGLSKETDGIIKHGSRTLLKQGHPKILNHYGLESTNIELSSFEIKTPIVKIGDYLQFHFHLNNKNEEAKTVRLEYAVHYKKAKGHLAKKVFKISEKIYLPNQLIKVDRNQSFKIITTRVFHTGIHQLSIIINGTESEVLEFELID